MHTAQHPIPPPGPLATLPYSSRGHFGLGLLSCTGICNWLSPVLGHQAHAHTHAHTLTHTYALYLPMSGRPCAYIHCHFGMARPISFPSLNHLSMSVKGMLSTSASSCRKPFTEFFHQSGGYLCHPAPLTSDLTFALKPSKLQQ